MEYFFLITYAILFIYIVNILWLCIGIPKVKSFHYHSIVPKTKFSIIVPFRNEAKNLPHLLQSFENLNYPTDLFEVILVDDESDDNFQNSTTKFQDKFQIILVQNQRKSNSPKKDAINTAILSAKNEWVLTTDADCEVNENWLHTLDAFIQKNNPKMIASGVIYNSQNNFLETFQQNDLLSLQGTTIGAFGNGQAFMCNGANFLYQKDFFYQLNGFEGNDNIASGDDVFLLQKALKEKSEDVFFLKHKSAIATTQPEINWQSLFQQRVRWASKTGNYHTFYSKQLGFSVFLMNLSLIITLLSLQLNLFLFVFSIKFIIDFVVLRITANFFEKPIRYLLPSSLVYPFFSSAVVIYSLFGKYDWKGRQFKM